MKEMFSKVSDIVADATDNVKDNLEKAFSVENIMEKLSDISDSSRDKVAAYTDQLISLTPIIEEIGFKTKEITLSIGLPPSATFHFEKFKDITPERREKILAEHKEKSLLGPLVKTLITADNYQDKIKMGAFKFNCIEITIGIPPSVNIKLVPKASEQRLKEIDGATEQQ